jgi:hypothetical protein
VDWLDWLNSTVFTGPQNWELNELKWREKPLNCGVSPTDLMEINSRTNHHAWISENLSPCLDVLKHHYNIPMLMFGFKISILLKSGVLEQS